MWMVVVELGVERIDDRPLRMDWKENWQWMKQKKSKMMMMESETDKIWIRRYWKVNLHEQNHWVVNCKVIKTIFDPKKEHQSIFSISR